VPTTGLKKHEIELLHVASNVQCVTIN
jgi:hypothetical protein